MLDWLIVGAGIHGLHLAAALRHRGDSLRLLDPHPRPLAAWDRCADALAMTHLRSGIEHDLDVGQLSLHHFAESLPERSAEPSSGWFSGPCRSPALALFRRHTGWIRGRLGLDELLMQGTAESIEAGHGAVTVDGDRGSIRARRVILALGRPQLCVPDWAEALGGSALHPFDPRFAPELSPESRAAVVVGGGLSAVQLALRWARARPGAVTLVCRRAPEVFELDMHTRWTRPSWARRFASFDIAGRQALLRTELRPGSIPRRVAARLARAQRRGLLRVCPAQVTRASSTGGAPIMLELSTGESLICDRLATATGFTPGFADVPLFNTFAERAGLARGPLATPLLDEALRWHPRVHVVGAAAQLAMGPAAANIAGARLAAQRVVRV